MKPTVFFVALLCLNLSIFHPTGCLALQDTGDSLFRAGAAITTITPPLGFSINGNFQDAMASHIHDDTHVRALVLDDGANQLALAMVDVCLLYREQIDQAKRTVSEQIGIPMQNIMIASTHTHSGGTTVSVFQSDPDPWYLDFVTSRIADAILIAYNRRVPARIGWGRGEEENLVFNRRWAMQPGTKLPNPFGGEDQVKMNPGIRNPALVKPMGPIDPELYLISVQTTDGRPLALWSNYSLHYVGGTNPGDISADYFGYYAHRIGEMLGTDSQYPPFVAILSNGTSGDINNIDFSGRISQLSGSYRQMERVANTLAAEAYKVVQGITYREGVSLQALQEDIRLGVRKPSSEEVTRAKEILAKAPGPVLLTPEEIFARETVLLQDYPDEVDLPIQVLRIGDLAITALPVEVFVEIGLDIKAQSPFEHTFTVSMANGYYGYLPTPEQHRLGGYETWRARSSYLEPEASPKLFKRVMELKSKLKEASLSQVFN